MGQLHKIISHDPSLSSRILKVVNSAFYGVSGQIGSVERAIVLLGLTAVKNIAVAASLGQLFRGAKLGAGFSAKDLWTHCIAVGVTSRDLAKRIRAANTDEFFLAGLIHDVGILVELQTWPEKIESICSTVKNKDANFCETERQVLGVDHQALGKGLAEQWKFTKVCQLVAGYHHSPAELEEDCPAGVGGARRRHAVLPERPGIQSDCHGARKLIRWPSPNWGSTLRSSIRSRVPCRKASPARWACSRKSFGFLFKGFDSPDALRAVRGRLSMRGGIRRGLDRDVPEWRDGLPNLRGLRRNRGLVAIPRRTAARLAASSPKPGEKHGKVVAQLRIEGPMQQGYRIVVGCFGEVSTIAKGIGSIEEQQRIIRLGLHRAVVESQGRLPVSVFQGFKRENAEGRDAAGVCRQGVGAERSGVLPDAGLAIG